MEFIKRVREKNRKKHKQTNQSDWIADQFFFSRKDIRKSKKEKKKLSESVFAIEVWKRIQRNGMTTDTEDHKTRKTEKNFSTKMYVHAFQTNRNECIALRYPVCMTMPPPTIFDKGKNNDWIARAKSILEVSSVH